MAPNHQIIENAQRILGVRFHQDYIGFIMSGYDLGESTLEPLQIDDPPQHVDMFRQCKRAWMVWGVPRTLLPIVHDNSDFYCINDSGGIDFWSHDAGSVVESWKNIHDWVNAMKLEG